MKESRIFIVGSQGQLGTALRAHYPKAHYADIDTLDITNHSSVEGFDWSGIDVLINAAAYTNVDGAETDEGRVTAWSVNADAVANLVAAAARHNMTLIHVSTDYVFNGKTNNHIESESFSPLSVYGSSKAAGDLAVRLTPKYYILRTSWVIGEGKNFVRTMMDIAHRNIAPSVVNDQIGRLTFTSELVRAIDFLLSHNDAPYGTYNISNNGDPVSWADITREIFTVMGRTDLMVTNISTALYFRDKELIARRPLLSTLDLTKIHKLGFVSRNWKDDLIEYVKKEGKT